MLVAPAGAFSGMRVLPPSALPASIRTGGVVGGLLEDLHRRFTAGGEDLAALQRLQRSLTDSLILTEPKSVAVSDVEDDLRGLFNAYVRVASGRASAPTKRSLLEKVDSELNRRGIGHELGFWSHDRRFDGVIINGQPRAVFEVLTFAANLKDWERVENDAGNFLFARQRVGLVGILAAQPPGEDAEPAAITSYERVTHWAEEEAVRVCAAPEEVADAAAALVLA
jgi:hypothetical protein